MTGDDHEPIRPAEGPQPAAMAGDRRHRLNLVKDFHRRERIDLPNAQIHAVVHVIVENQIALAEDVPVRTLKRLQQEGLDRHDAIHAMAMVMLEYLPGILTAEPANTAGIRDPGNSIFAALEKLTADSWRHSMDDEDELASTSEDFGDSAPSSPIAVQPVCQFSVLDCTP